MSTSTNPSEPRPRRGGIFWLSVVVILLVLIGLGLYALWIRATGSDTGVARLNAVSPSLVPPNRLVQNLEGSDPDLQRESLAVLTDRKDASGVSAALPLLKSDDAYVWFNAALYLGSLNRREAVPYLIKGLRHHAWRAHQDCANDLVILTGQNLGTDFEKWHQWWKISHPASGFDFDSNLGD